LGYRGESSGGKSTCLFHFQFQPFFAQLIRESAIPSKISVSDATNSAAPVAAITLDKTNEPAVITSTRPSCI